jgi:hypothetical protein
VIDAVIDQKAHNGCTGYLLYRQRQKMQNLITSIILLFALTTPLAASDSPDPLFQENETLEVTITAPLTTLIRKRPKEDYLPGLFSLTGAGGTSVDFDVEIRTRGHFRHNTCDFPPLSLNFKKSQTNETLFDKQDKLKLVVHCDDPARYEQAVLREYLAYRLLNALTDLSFRVRLLRVTYVDNEGRRDEQVRYAFLIEHKNRLASRLDRKDLKIERTSIGAIQPDLLNLTSMFEFMIGNVDFSPVAGAPNNECCHNYVLFGNDVDPIIAIPYDFDQSGFVDAPYAVPSEQLRQRTVRQRIYRGRCVNNGYVGESVARFGDGRDAIYTLVAGQEGLDSRVRKSIVRFIDDFYKIIDDSRQVERKIIDKCL